MALSDKDILITPNIGSSTDDPKIEFTGATSSSSSTITVSAIDLDGGTLSFEGSAGQLFSVTNNLTSGSIFSVNDVSGVPSIDVNADGTILLAPFETTPLIGIGKTNPSYALDISGSILATGNITAYSDITLKKNIEVIPNALDKVSQIRGVTFDRIDLEDEPRQSGVIAQEIEKVLPEVVRTTQDGTKTVAYGNMVGLLIEAIKEQQKQIDDLRAKLEEGN